MENETKEVTTSGNRKWVISKPKAGPRNRAMMKAELGNGGFNRTMFISELLPSCIRQRPEDFDKDVPIASQLDSLEIEDYDDLASTLFDLVENKEEKKTI